jgi:3-hydroxybutyryl-CoA dehydratase
MNDARYADLSLGQTARFERAITGVMLDQFQRLSGDRNPLHADKAYALKHGYSDRVVHGLLAGSLYSKLVGTYLPGRYALLHEITIQFLQPVYPGDILVVSGTISYLNDAYRRVEVLAKSTNQKGECTSKAKIKVGLLE